MKITVKDTFGYKFHTYFEGKSYDVPAEVGHLAIGQGWADNAARGLDTSELDEPFDHRTATDEDTPKWEKWYEENLAKAQRRIRGEQEPDLDVQDGVLGTESDF